MQTTGVTSSPKIGDAHRTFQCRGFLSLVPFRARIPDTSQIPSRCRANLRGRGIIHPMKFRFSIRDLLWLTLVVAFCLALWQQYRRTLEARFQRNDEHAIAVEADNKRRIAEDKMAEMQWHLRELGIKIQ